VTTGQEKVVAEAVFRYDEVTRLIAELGVATKAWQDWLRGLTHDEFAAYLWRLEHRDPDR